MSVGSCRSRKEKRQGGFQHTHILHEEHSSLIKIKNTTIAEQLLVTLFIRELRAQTESFMASRSLQSARRKYLSAGESSSEGGINAAHLIVSCFLSRRLPQVAIHVLILSPESLQSHL